MSRFAELCYLFIDGKITQEEINRELVEMAFVPEQWTEATKILQEPEMPKELKDYYATDPSIRAKINEGVYFRKFSEYFKLRDQIRFQNERKLEWLHDLKGMVPVTDTERQKMIDVEIVKVDNALSLMRRPDRLFAGAPRTYSKPAPQERY